MLYVQSEMLLVADCSDFAALDLQDLLAAFDTTDHETLLQRL
jgi:hypothetical protein